MTDTILPKNFGLLLSRGLTTTLCERGYEFAKQWKWCASADGYAKRSIRVKKNGKDSSITKYFYDK